MNSRRRITAALVGLLMLVTGGWLGHHALADPPTGGHPVAVASAGGLPVRALSKLPPQAAHVWELIQQGGPFPYPRDGVTFGNRERLLPPQRSGYYREYTVPTPGEDDRGARRIVAGDDGRLLSWTDDHYASVARVQR